jgi:hypothetical protein
MERRKKRQEDDCGEQRVPVGLQYAEAVTHWLDHASRVYSTCELEVPELGYTRVRVVHLLRDKFFLRSGWIGGSSPAMTEVSAYDRNMLER